MILYAFAIVKLVSVKVLNIWRLAVYVPLVGKIYKPEPD